MPDAVGVIYGNVSSTRFDVAVNDDSLRRLDYVAVEQAERVVLGQVEKVVRKTSLSFEDAMTGDVDNQEEDKISASVHVIGYVDDAGRVQTPRSPFRAGQTVERADATLVTAVLGLEGGSEGAYLGHIKGSSIPVNLSMNTLAQKHLSVLAKTGAGKSYTVGVILEEFLKADVPLVILDPHGEYGSLRYANIEEGEIAAMKRFGVKPKSFAKKIREFALDTRINPDAERLVLEGMNLEGRDIVDLVGGQITGGQVGLLYQAVKEVKDHLPAYTLKDVMDAVSRNKSNARWNVLNALESLDATGVFGIRGTAIEQLVKPGQCTIVNLKGVSPDIQEVVVTRIANFLWEGRKRSEVPPHILVCEEAHNFCPERGVGSAISGPVLRTVASEGRKFGMGLVIVSQRPAKIDKNVLSQCNTQVVLKVTNPNDLKAIVASVEGITSETADEVQRLPIGSALVAGGGLTQPVFVDIRPRITRHGGRSVEMVGAEADANGWSEAKGETPPWMQTEAPVEEPAAPSAAPERPPTPAQVNATRASPPASPESDWKPAANEWTPAHGRSPYQGDPVAAATKREDERRTAPVASKPEPRVAAKPEEPTRPEPRRGLEFKAMTAPRKVEERPIVPEKAQWGPGDVDAIHRVASRIGLVQPSREPTETQAFIERLAIRNRRDPDARLGMYAEIARRVCHDDSPTCIRCPLSERCEYHARMQEERQKERHPIRRLWRK